MTPVLQNITSSIPISKIQAKNPRTLTLICHYAISLDLRLSSPNPHAKQLSLFRTFLLLSAFDLCPVPRPRYILSGFVYGPMLDGKGWLVKELVLVEIAQLEAYFSHLLAEKGCYYRMGNQKN